MDLVAEAHEILVSHGGSAGRNKKKRGRRERERERDGQVQMEIHVCERTRHEWGELGG